MAEDCANPLFAEWLKEWWDVERERNTKAQIVYRKAYQSMKACATALQHASQAAQLNGIGPKMVRRLEEKYKEHCLENGLSMPEKPSRKNRVSANLPEKEAEQAREEADEPPTKRRKTKEYVPQLRSGAYAILKALGELEQNSSQALSKTELIDRSQPYCDSSFTVPSDPTKYYTAWKSMETLLQKELVYTRGHPIKRYQLTDEGWRMALKMQAQERGRHIEPQKKPSKSKPTAVKGHVSSLPVAEPAPSQDLRRYKDLQVMDLSSDSEQEQSHAPLPKTILLKENGPSSAGANLIDPIGPEPIVLNQGTFEVKLVLDSREVRTQKDREYIATELRIKHDVVADVRPLPLGDVLWVAKLKSPHDVAFQGANAGDDDEGSTEVVLEHIVERKRLDDLIASMKDGRLNEQKFRLKKSGMRHVIYILETITLSSERQEAYGQSMDSIIAQMQVVDDIFVKQTSKMDDTIKYLARLTQTIKQKYEAQKLHVLPSRSLDVTTHRTTLDRLRAKSPTNAYCMTFSAFCSLCDKSDSLMLRDIFLKMLMCTHGITGEKAIQIQKIWPTPKALIDAYESLGSDTDAKEAMVSDRLGKAIDRKRVAKALSAKVAGVWAGL